MPPANHLADRILSMNSDGHVHTLVSDLIRERELSSLVRALNSDVLAGRAPERDKAIAALRRMGLWLDS